MAYMFLLCHVSRRRDPVPMYMMYIEAGGLAAGTRGVTDT